VVSVLFNDYSRILCRLVDRVCLSPGTYCSDRSSMGGQNAESSLVSSRSLFRAVAPKNLSRRIAFLLWQAVFFKVACSPSGIRKVRTSVMRF